MNRNLVKSDSFIVSEEEAESYLPAKQEQGQLGNLGKGDYKTPRIILLQGLSPQIQDFPGEARAGEFWHTGMNKPLGEEFNLIVCQPNKKVILWRPRWDSDGGILAFSRNAVDWEFGGDSEFEVRPLKDDPKYKVTWRTGKNVPSSGLTMWGSFDPENDESGPAAQEVFEYVCYLPDYPELSPVLFGLQRTALPNAKALNTMLIMHHAGGRPVYSLGLKCFSQEMSRQGNRWTVPHFKSIGFANQQTYEASKKIAEEWKDVTKVADYQQETQEPIDDKIAF